MRYILKHSIGKDIGTDYPQSQEMSEGYLYYLPNSVYNIYNNEPLNVIPNLNSFVLTPRSSLTDLISTATFSGLIISEKLKKIINSIILPSHKFYKASLIYKNDLIEDYYYLHFNSGMLEFIDFSKSLFVETDCLGDFLSELKIQTKDGYLEIKKSMDINNLIKIKELVLTDAFYNTNYDIANFSISINYYISDKLKNMLDDNKITGIESLKIK